MFLFVTENLKCFRFQNCQKLNCFVMKFCACKIVFFGSEVYREFEKRMPGSSPGGVVMLLVKNNCSNVRSLDKIHPIKVRFKLQT